MVRLAFYGDDFTGSVDALLQLRRTGLDGVLVTSAGGVGEIDGDSLDVVGIAGVARSLPTAELADEVRPAFEHLLALQPDVLQYKACSTADSSPEVGSLGRVIEIGRELVGPAVVPVLLAQPGFGRYTAFSHHFAADDGEVHRIDRQPTMANHPVTPATESDLRRHLGAQTTLHVAGAHWTGYDGDGALTELFRRHGEADVLVLDALTDDHLCMIGAALAASTGPQHGVRFVLGSGGLSRAYGLGVKDRPDAPLPTGVAPASGPTLVLSGSASALTWRQVQAAAAAGFATLDLFADGTGDRTARLIEQGGAVVVHSTRPGLPLTTSSAEIEERLAAIGAACLQRRRDTRLVVAGGDTSGNVLRRLGIETLRIVTNPWGMVPLCRATGTAEHLHGGVEVALKGGQMGHDTLFDDIRSGTPLR